MEKIKKHYIAGGIGDFLQYVPFVIKEKDKNFLIHTHFQNAKAFFEYLEVKNCEFLFFSNLNEFESQKQKLSYNYDLKPSERSFIYNFPLNNTLLESNEEIKNSFKEDKKIIGIHPFGSEFANNVAKKINVSLKKINTETIYDLIDDKFNYLIFGTRQELEDNKFYETENVKFICFSDVMQSLAAIKICNLVIATDSCFKNMACINGIKTFCILGDYKDEFRDKYFIEVYQIAGILETLKINKETNEENIKEYIKYSYKFIK